jgi:hypothetical protein
MTMPEATYSEMLLRWKILLFLLEKKKAGLGEVKPQPSKASTTERRESCRE